MTKRTILEAINALDITENIQVGEDVVTPEDIKAEVAKMIEQLDAKAAKAKAKAAEKKSEGDAAGHAIEKLLTSEPQTINDILSQLQTIEGYEDFTSAKIVPRLKRLVDLGTVTKSDVKVDNRKVKAYSIITDTEVIE